MATDYIRYDLLVQDALRSVVRKVLSEAAKSGLPGEHHFNISFKTQAPGVMIPNAIRQRYPEEMAIILQHEFWDLEASADSFSVSLNFSRRPERLTIPFDAITGFSDPSVPFGFKLEPRIGGETAPSSVRPPVAKLEEPAPAKATKHLAKPATAPRAVEPLKAAETPAAKPAEGDPTKVVSIDSFRKK